MPRFSSTRPSVTCMYPSHRNYLRRKHHPDCAGEETDSEAVYNPNPMSSLDHEALKTQITEPPSPFQTSQTSILTQRPPLHPGSKGLPCSTFETAELCPVSRATLTCLDLIRSPPALKKGHFLKKKKNCFIGTHLNIRYTWCWLARTVRTFDTDGAKTKTVTGHDGERWREQKPDFGEENESQSDSVRMQNLVQQNPFTKYKFITKTWKDNLRKGKKDERKAAEGRRQEGERKKRGGGNERKRIQLSTTEAQKLTCPNGIKAWLCNLIVRQSMRRTVLHLPSVPVLRGK